MRLTHALALAAALTAAGPSPAGTGAAGAIPWKLPSYTLVARDMDLRMALDSFAVSEGLSVVMSDQVVGRFSGDFKSVPPDEFLEKIATVHNLMWYYDGAALYVCGAGEIQTLLLDLRYMKAGELTKMLGELGVEDRRFPLKTTSNDELIMVSGPPRYVALVAETIAKADRLREMRTVNEIETRLFPLENTWADDVSFNVSSPESTATIRGVARLLDEMMSSGGGRSSVDASLTNTVSALDAAQISSFRPVIRPENRINAVVVRDAAARMPMYERLIHQLDVPQKLVEIAVTTVELSRDDALDWQLSLALAGSRGHDTGSIGQNAQNLFSPAELAGQGLAGALTHIHSAYSIAASLNALRAKGKARNIARTTLLTINNLAAEMSDSQSYHARVVGTEVASLEEVSAGTRLQVKPRIVEGPGGLATNQVWLTLRLDDGGFESVTVDSMPMTRATSLQTQTAVMEGESIMLAGYLRDIEESGGWGIPYLRDIPWIGWLFGGVSVKKETVQRMFLLTPHVVDLDAHMLARLQATKLRDVTEEEKIADDAEESDDERRRRDLEREEARRKRREKFDDRYERRKAEIEHIREMRRIGRRFTKEELEEDVKAWREEEDIAMKAAKAVFEGTEILREKKRAEKSDDAGEKEAEKDPD